MPGVEPDIPLPVASPRCGARHVYDKCEIDALHLSLYLTEALDILVSDVNAGAVN